jgi:hypothetical protein
VQILDPSARVLPTIALYSSVTQVAFTSEGRYLAAAHENGMLSILRLPMLA